MDGKQVVELMRSSTSAEAWNKNAAQVKAACNGFPEFWYMCVVLSGVMVETQSTWGIKEVKNG